MRSNTWSTPEDCVRVILLRAQSSGVLHVFERIVHQSSLAALVAVRFGAINQLLLRQSDNIISSGLCLDGGPRFNSTGGRKGPARSALSLVLHSRHIRFSIHISPINSIRCLIGGFHGHHIYTVLNSPLGHTGSSVSMDMVQELISRQV